MNEQERKIRVMSVGALLSLAFLGIMIALSVYRLFAGLGAVTNLSDEVPWGLWIGVDVLAGVALAAGGFVIAGAVYIFNMKKYKPIARAAILTAFIGYIIVSVAIFFDIGKPLTLWHPLVMWQPTSVMFEVVWCVVIYTVVLALEFAGSFLEGIGAKRAAQIITNRKVLVPLAIAAITLSFLHQSSLGALFLLMPGKLNHLWWTTMLPYNFFLSAVSAGMAMVTIEYVLASKIFKHRYDISIVKGLARGTAIMLLVYFILRLGDITFKGNLLLMFSSGLPALLFFIEMIILVLLPMFILFNAASANNSGSNITLAQALVLMGVILNRLDILLLVQYKEGFSYYPTIIEMLITVGLIAAIVFAYRLAMLKLPIVSTEK